MNFQNGLYIRKTDIYITPVDNTYKYTSVPYTNFMNFDLHFKQN